MDINWYGHSCFRIAERGKASVVTDPYDESIGYGPLNLKAEVVTMSHEMPGHANLDAVKEWRVSITRPGEYEVGGVFVIGVPVVNKRKSTRFNVAYSIDYGNLKVLHLGDLDHVPSQSSLDALGQADIVMVPVGGGEALNANQAAELIAMLEPRIVLPMHYQTPHSLLELSPVEKFLTEMGVTSPVETDMLRITASNLPEQTQVVLLQYKQQ